VTDKTNYLKILLTVICNFSVDTNDVGIKYIQMVFKALQKVRMKKIRLFYSSKQTAK